MGITQTNKRYLLWTTLFAVVVRLGIWGIYEAFFPEYYFAWYPAIPVFFYLFSWYYIYMFDLYRKRAPKKLLSVYMGMKFVKMAVSVLLLFLYIWFVGEQKTAFLLTFFVFYMLTLLNESVFFSLFERNLKKKLEKRNG